MIAKDGKILNDDSSSVKIERSETHINSFTKKFMDDVLVYTQTVSPDEEYVVKFVRKRDIMPRSLLEVVSPTKRFLAKLVRMNPTYMRVMGDVTVTVKRNGQDRHRDAGRACGSSTFHGQQQAWPPPKAVILPLERLTGARGYEEGVRALDAVGLEPLLRRVAARLPRFDLAVAQESPIEYEVDVLREALDEPESLRQARTALEHHGLGEAASVEKAVQGVAHPEVLLDNGRRKRHPLRGGLEDQPALVG